MKVGIIGTGMLGNAVGLHLLDCGFELIAYNRTKEKIKQLEQKGAKVAHSPKEVAENSDLVITIVKDAIAVSDVLFGKNGIVSGKHKNIVVADMSTINPDEAREIASRLQDKKIAKLEIPVMGGPNVAISGELVVMCSGNKQIFEKFKHIFEKIGNNVFFLGESGTANSVKLAMNLQITMLALALSEGITLVRKTNVDPKIFLEILNSTYFKTGMSQNKAYKMIDNKFDATFTLENLKKDIDTILRTAEAYNVNLPMIKNAQKIYQDAIKKGFGKIDYTGILAYLKKINES